MQPKKQETEVFNTQGAVSAVREVSKQTWGDINNKHDTDDIFNLETKQDKRTEEVDPYNPFPAQKANEVSEYEYDEEAVAADGNEEEEYYDEEEEGDFERDDVHQNF